MALRQTKGLLASPIVALSRCGSRRAEEDHTIVLLLMDALRPSSADQRSAHPPKRSVSQKCEKGEFLRSLLRRSWVEPLLLPTSSPLGATTQLRKLCNMCVVLYTTCNTYTHTLCLARKFRRSSLAESGALRSARSCVCVLGRQSSAEHTPLAVAHSATATFRKECVCMCVMYNMTRTIHRSGHYVTNCASGV